MVDAVAAGKDVYVEKPGKIQMGIIGCGNRGTGVLRSFAKHADSSFVAACDVDSTRLERAVQQIGSKVDTYEDYRRLLENKAVDAVLIATPDHWHSQIMVDAVAAGKDVYVEKPVSNSLDGAQKMLEAYQKTKQVVQVGCQQRSWPHFQQACKLIQDGLLGLVNHAVCLFPGGYAGAMQPPEAPPATLNWDMWQGPAPRKSYSPSRSRWRAFYDYGGGLVTDWGVHLTDIVHLALNSDRRGPLLATGSGQYVTTVRDPEQVPDTLSCSWQYERFQMTFTNLQLPAFAEAKVPTTGNWFFGQRGTLLLNRTGYRIWPAPVRRSMPAAGGPGRGTSFAPAPAMQPAPLNPPIEAGEFVTSHPDPDGLTGPDEGTDLHTRNFLDCVKSRRKPVCDMEIGFYSTLPCLLALMSIRQGHSFAWDGTSARPA